MVTREQYEDIKRRVIDYLEQANIVLTEEEKANIEIADFGLNRIYEIGLQLVEYINTDRVCAKELVLLPGQTCPEHLHPPFGAYPGKEETFRCRYGKVHLFVEGEPTANPLVSPPDQGKEYYTVGKEIVLTAGEQYTLPVNTRHWFKAGEDGAIITEFSTTSYDEQDIFTDPHIMRLPIVE